MNLQKNEIYLKVGDELLCHTSCMMNKVRKTTTVGKTYTITEIDRYDRILIIDDEHTEHYFSKSKDSCYEKWFHSSSKIIRKKKLEKILKING